MRKIISTILLVTVVAIIANSSAEPITIEKPVMCERTEVIVKMLAEDYEEQPTWGGVGAADSTRMVLFENRERGTWTLIEYKGVTACVLGAGDQSQHRRITSSEYY